MKLTRIELKDFRCFGEAELDLTEPGSGGEPLGVALLVGDNGSGKSAVVKGLSGFFTELSSIYGGQPLEPSDIRHRAERAKVAVQWIDWLGHHEPKCALLSNELVLEEHGVIPPLTKPSPTRYREWLGLTLGGPRQPTGLVVAFDVHRLLKPGPVVGPNLQEVISSRCQNALAPTISTDGKIRARAQGLKQWIVNLDSLRAKAKADRNEDLPLWHTLREALNILLHPYTFEGVDDRFQVLFQTATGRVPIEELSDGFRSVFVIVAELLLRLSLATSDPAKILEQEAVCIIDELDGNLHPRWQETIIPGLTAMFPNVQFIATTHSEIIVSTVEPKNVFRLELADDGSAYTAVRQDKRFHRPERSVVSVDREVFGAPPGSAGSQWILNPPPTTLRSFWEHYASEIPRDAYAFVAEGKVLIEGVADAHDRPLHGLEGRSGEAALFFIDLDPMADWAHPCAYILWPDNGEPLRIEHHMPPSEAFRLLPLPRPPRL